MKKFWQYATPVLILIGSVILVFGGTAALVWGIVMANPHCTTTPTYKMCTIWHTPFDKEITFEGR